jgi:alanine or glycine:cation symporter, AGCS family
LGFTAFITGNAVQANTLADTMESNFGMSNLVTGLIASAVIAAVILGGITRIGKVTAVLAPVMAAVYVAGALGVILLNIGDVIPTFGLIFREAFSPSAGVAGTGIGVLLVTMNWGVNRGLFSNEAGQGSAPIAHAAAKTDEPVSEGVVGLVEPFIDTIVIVTMTCLVIVMTGVYDDRFPSEMTLNGGDRTFVTGTLEAGLEEVSPENEPSTIRVSNGVQSVGANEGRFAWHDIPVEMFYTEMAAGADGEMELRGPFTGTIDRATGVATGDNGTEYTMLYANQPEGGAPLTQLGFKRGLSPLGDWGGIIVVVSVILFAISTAISWSYYGDRCARYIFGARAVMPYKFAYVGMHLVGALIAPAAAWDLGDVALGIVILPNLLALIWLSKQTKEMMSSYFDRKPWENQPHGE